MSCPKNIKTGKFLFWRWKYEGEHDWEYTKVGDWGLDLYEIDKECKICGTEKRDWGLEYEKLVRLGFRKPDSFDKRKFGGGYNHEYDPREIRTQEK